MTQCIAVRIEVPSYRSASCLHALVELLQRHGASASFVFSLGPDWLGRSLARQGAPVLRQVRDAGFEVGIHGWNAPYWTKQVEQADSAWSATQLTQTLEAFERVFATPPRLHTAPGWRSNPHALRLTQRLNFAYASDMRGRHPFIPVWNGEIVRCPQIPTTLPTLDELATSARPDPDELASALLALTLTPPPLGHVFSLRAGSDSGRHSQVIEKLLAGWHEQGYEVTSIQALADGLQVDKLPRHEVEIGKVPGRNGTLLLQGNEFLSAWRNPA
jgi:undecaprenyl phosphate-alpha-L-ara4FN deformylase